MNAQSLVYDLIDWIVGEDNHRSNGNRAGS
jgi:hypothetical protein